MTDTTLMLVDDDDDSAVPATRTRYLNRAKLAELTVRPEADRWPLPPDDSSEEEEFRVSLGSGQRSPIVLCHGELLGGRRLVRAVVHHRILPGLLAIDRDDVDPQLEVLDIQFRQRETTKPERALAVTEPDIVKCLKAEAKKRQGRFRPNSDGAMAGTWREVAARMAKCGKSMIDDAYQLHQYAAPSLMDSVRSGDVSISAGAVLAKTKEAEAQTEVLAQGSKTLKAEAKKLRSQKRKSSVIEAQELSEPALVSVAILPTSGPQNAPLSESTQSLRQRLSAAGRSVLPHGQISDWPDPTMVRSDAVVSAFDRDPPGGSTTC